MRLSIALVLSIILAVGAYAAKSKVRIAYIDLQKTIQSVETGKKAKATLEKDFLERKNKIEEMQKDIKKMSDEFERKSMVMNEDTRKKKQTEIQTKMLEYQRLVQQSQMEIANRERELTAPIVQEIQGIVSKIAEKEDYEVVLEKNESAILYAIDGADITDNVIEEYNKKSKKKK